jgi:hypothetical protein
MVPSVGSGREHIAEPLSTIVPEHLHVRTILPTIFNMAVHSVLAKAVRRERYYTNPQKITFDMHSLAGRMECFDFEYEAMAPSLDGKGRQQVTDVLKLAAINAGDESGIVATTVLNEGAKNLSGKGSKTK